MSRVTAFQPGATATLAVTTTSAAATISAGYPTLEIQNDGAVTAFVAWAPSAAVATVAAGYPILAGQSKTITIEHGHTSLAAITASGTTTLYITSGEGL